MNMKIKRATAFMLSALTAAAMFAAGNIGAYAAEGAERFTDVTMQNPQYAAIDFCAERGFINGVSATQFAPNSALTREQLALIWARTFHVKPPHNFRDVARVSGGEADNAIVVMHALGFLNGISDNEYGRNMTMTREQAAVVLFRTYLPGVDGGDSYEIYGAAADISEYARNAISACIEWHLFEGAFTGDELFPKNPITRAELCRLIYNLMHDETEEPEPTPTPTEEEPTPPPSEGAAETMDEPPAGEEEPVPAI
ncbi:MAG: S-layer homology domain-containing protein [Oscillospiraceae bacterium]|nr:S-layer homology domain-containing protein [Oscillospiraceae bacterium]